MNTDSHLITTAEAARLLGKSTRTVQRMVKAGALRPEASTTGGRGAHLFHRDSILIIAQRTAA